MAYQYSDYNPPNNIDKVKSKPYYNMPQSFYPNFNTYNNPYNNYKNQPINYNCYENGYNYNTQNNYSSKNPHYNNSPNYVPFNYNNINNQYSKYNYPTNPPSYANTLNNLNQYKPSHINSKAQYYNSSSTNNYNNSSSNNKLYNNYNFCAKNYNTLNSYQPYDYGFENTNSYTPDYKNAPSRTYDNPSFIKSSPNNNNISNDYNNFEYSHNDYINHVCDESYNNISNNTTTLKHFFSATSCVPVISPNAFLLYDIKSINSSGNDIKYYPNNGMFFLSAGHCYIVNIYISGFTGPFNKLFFTMALNGCATGGAPIQSEAINSYNSAVAYTIISTNSNTKLQILNATNGFVNNVNSSISIVEIA